MGDKDRAEQTVGLSESGQASLAVKIIDDVIHNLTLLKQKQYVFHLDDIGNEIGRAVGHNTCVDEKDQNIWAFQKNDFISGFQHGYSLQDGTHGR